MIFKKKIMIKDSRRQKPICCFGPCVWVGFLELLGRKGPNNLAFILLALILTPAVLRSSPRAPASRGLATEPTAESRRRAGRRGESGCPMPSTPPSFPAPIAQAVCAAAERRCLWGIDPGETNGRGSCCGGDGEACVRIVEAALLQVTLLGASSSHHFSEFVMLSYDFLSLGSSLVQQSSVQKTPNWHIYIL